MRYRIKTNKKPGTISIDLKGDTSITIKGIDPDEKNRKFFERIIEENGTYNFGIPMASKFIDVIIKQNVPDKETGFSVESIKYNKLRKKPIFMDMLTAQFLEFATIFSFNAGTYKPGVHTDKNKIFKIRILPYIKGTPARINIENNEIEVCGKEFIKDTVAGRNWLLMHEFSHNFLSSDPDSEYEADFYANILQLAQGYPIIESYNMVASFSGTELNGNRLKQTEEMLDDFEADIYFKR